MSAKNFKRYINYEGFINVIGSRENYTINKSGIVKDNKGKDVRYKRDSRNELIVNITSWDGTRDYRIIDLLAIHFKDITIPIEDYNNVEAFHADNDPNNIHIANIGYRFKGGKLEHRKYKGYYYVPSMNNLIINERGDTYRFSNGKWSTVTYGITKGGSRNSKGGYRKSSVSFGLINIPVSRHRALCLTFKPYPNNVDDLDVNHINGVPGDDRLENLEWASRSDNNLHAYKNDLKDQHARVLIRNARTGEVTEYYSIAECARKLGFNSVVTTWHRIKKAPFSQVFHDGLQIKLKDDPRDWIIPDDVEEAIKAAKSTNTPIKVRNVDTNVVTECETVVDACAIVNTTHITIMKMADIGMIFKGYQAKYVDDDTEWPAYTKKEYILSFCNDSVPIEARNVLTGETNKFISLADATRCFPKTIVKSLRDGKQQLFSNGWQVKYPWDEWREVENPEETCYKLRTDVCWKNENTGEVGIASNAKNAAIFLGWVPGVYPEIRQAALTRGNKIYRGYRFRLGVTDEPWPNN